MHLYAAPMEGLTGYVFRNAHRTYFPGADAYFTPFVAPNQNHEFASREINDLLPAHNTGTPVIPQVLSANASDFLWAVESIADMGYTEVNLNLGCPSPTVVTKGKGSGMLGDPDKLDRFLDEIFKHTPIKISIKTRIGLNDAGYLGRFIEIFGKYPVHELTVHPRIQTDMYKKPVRREAFEEIMAAYKGPVIYNGDLCSQEDISSLANAHSNLSGVMCGRGLIANPYLFGAYKNLPVPGADTLRAFHDSVFEGYKETMPGDKALLFKMKELWYYMASLFPDRGNFDKKLKKAAKISEYTAAVGSLFETCSADFSASYHS